MYKYFINYFDYKNGVYMLFAKRLMCLSLLMSLSFNSMYTMETQSTDTKAKKTLTAKEITTIVHKQPLLGLTPGAPLNCPGYEYIHGNIVPSLRQNGAYCGYYAVFNARLMLSKKTISDKNRDECCVDFKNFLSQQLTQSTGIPGWRNAEEVCQLLTPNDQNILVIDPTAFFTAVDNPTEFMKQIETNTELTGIDNQAHALRNFKNKISHQIAIIALVGNDHWIAIYAEQQDDTLILKIADSNNGTSCATKPATLRKYILPFYYALTKPFKDWPKYFTKEYFNELDLGAQARELKGCEEKKRAHAEEATKINIAQQPSAKLNPPFPQSTGTPLDQATRKLSKIQRLTLLHELMGIHILPLPRDLQLQPKSVSYDCTITDWLQFTVIKVPALEENHPGYRSEASNFGAYYALYNAICFCDPKNNVMLDRMQFISFLGLFFDLMQERAPNKPINNPGITDIRSLASCFETLPIVCLELDKLSQVTGRYKIPKVTKNMNDAKKYYAKNLEQLHDFQHEKSTKLVIIAHCENSWYTLCCERNSSGAQVQVADSCYCLGYNESGRFSLKDFEKAIIPFYSVVFEQSIKAELKSHFEQALSTGNLQWLSKNIDRLQQYHVASADEAKTCICALQSTNCPRQGQDSDEQETLEEDSDDGFADINQEKLKPRKEQATPTEDRPSAAQATSNVDKEPGQSQTPLTTIHDIPSIDPKDMSLSQAIQAGNLDRVIQLLQNNVAINQTDPQGMSLLHLAVLAERLPVISELLDRVPQANIGQFINRYDANGYTALHYAVRSNKQDVVERLLREKAIDVNLPKISTKPSWVASFFVAARGNDDHIGWTALHFAACAGNDKILSKLLAKDNINVNAINGHGDGVTALIMACIHGHVECVQLLVDKKADLNIKYRGETTLAWAIEYEGEKESLSIMKILFEHGAYSESLLRGLCLYHLALPQILRLAIDHHRGPLPQSRDFLWYILDPQSLEDLTALIERGIAIKDLNTDQNQLIQALNSEHFASKLQRPDRMKLYTLLLEQGLKVPFNQLNKKAADLRFPLHIAAQVGNFAVVEKLRRQAHEFPDLLSVNARDAERRTPLHYAAENGQMPIIEFLCQEGADKIQEDMVHETPIHIAAKHNHREVVKYLLAGKVQELINMQKQSMRSPLMHALIANAADTACELVDKQADARLEENGLLELPGNTEWSDDIVFHFQPSRTIPAIASEHMLLSPYEEIATHPLNIGTTFTGLGMEGFIVPSLQQTRPDWQITAYSGYYALYNALSFLNPEAYPQQDRKAFVQSFVQDLKSIWTKRKHGPYDNLTADELRDLIQENYNNMPTVVVEKSELYNIISGKAQENPLARIVGNDAQALAHWNNFVHGNIPNIVIIAGSDRDCGHWITIHAIKIDNHIVLEVADSLYKVSSWEYNDRIATEVLPWFLALSHNPTQWQEIFDAQLQQEIFEEYLADDQAIQFDDSIHASLQETCQTLQTFSHIISGISESFRTTISRITKAAPLNEQQLRLMALRFNKFFSLITRLERLLTICRTLEIKSEKTKPALIAMIRTLLDQTTAIKQCILAINTQAIMIDETEQSHAIGIINKILDYTETLETQTQVVIACCTKTTQELQNTDITDASMLTLDEDLLRTILASAPLKVKHVVTHLKAANIQQVEQQLIRMIFVGLPGNGKTTLGQAIAQASNRPIKFIRVPALGNKYQHSKEDGLKFILPFIQKNPHAVIILDELDAIKDRDDEPNRAAELLQLLLDLCARKYPNVVFIGTTNDPEAIPRPLFSRFSQAIIEIPNPDYTMRLSTINRLCSQNAYRRNTLTEQDKKQLAKNTNDFSIRHIEEMFRAAQLASGNNPITQELMQTAYQEVNKNVEHEPVNLAKISNFVIEHREEIINTSYIALQEIHRYHDKKEQKEIRQKEEEKQKEAQQKEEEKQNDEKFWCWFTVITPIIGMVCPCLAGGLVVAGAVAHGAQMTYNNWGTIKAKTCGAAKYIKSTFSGITRKAPLPRKS